MTTPGPFIHEEYQSKTTTKCSITRRYVQQEGKLHLPCAKSAQGINDHKIDFFRELMWPIMVVQN